MIHRKFLPLAALAGFALATSAHGALLVYEGFNYTPASATNDPGSNQGETSTIILTGNGGTTEVGLGGTWSNANNNGNNMYLVEGSLGFGDLPTSGNHIRYRNNQQEDRYHRAITVDLSGGDELWFSFLANRLQNNFSAGREGIAIANNTLNSAQFDNVTGAGRHGFGIAATAGGDGGSAWQAWGWDGSDATVSTGSFSVATNGSETNLLVGRIQFNAGGNGEDIFTAYHYNRAFVNGSVTADIANLVQFGQILVDADESLLDILNITRQVNTAYDEIRIGTTFASVIPEPTTVLLGSFGLLFLLRRRR